MKKNSKGKLASLQNLEKFHLSEVDKLKLALAESQMREAVTAHNASVTNLNIAQANLNAANQGLANTYSEGGKYEIVPREDGRVLHPETGVGHRRLKRPITHAQKAAEAAAPAKAAP